MQQIFKSALLSAALILITSSVSAGQFVIELDAPLKPIPSELLTEQNIKLDQSFSAGTDSYAVVSANHEEALKQFLTTASIDAIKISEVLFVNSPTVGGGLAAGDTPRDGHTTFIIERPIPGVGFFGLEKKQKISKGSNAAIEKLGDIIEWDQSYLTSEGTYCVYRADSTDTLREHGALAGAPIGKITEVTQKIH